MKGSVNWYNPLISFMINYYYLPFKQAYKMPIACYRWPRFISLYGKIIIESERIYYKMIRLNTIGHNPYHSCGNFEYVNDGGTLIFKGSANITSGSRIMIYNEGVIIFGNNFHAKSINIGCQERITFGNDINIAAGTVIYDSNFHYIHNKKKNIVKNIHQNIAIGDKVWIGTRAYITKGVQIPQGCIISANAVIAKPISEINDYSIIAGNPAKVVAEGYVRICGPLENYLFEEFTKNQYAQIQINDKI